MKVITFLSDFGLKDGYVAQMKGVASEISDAKLIDITHEISPQNVFEGAYILRTSVPYFPKGTVHIAVVDPGVGTQRRGIVVTAGKHILVGPDNGLLLPVAHYLGNYTVYEIENKKYMLSHLSNTFHGRDIFTPIASHISNGVSIEDIGTKINSYNDIDFGKGEIKGTAIVGKVIHIDRFGNIITNISGDLVLKNISFNDDILFSIGNKSVKAVFVVSYGYKKKDMFLATLGSNNFFEIAINQGNAAESLSVKPGSIVKIFVN